MKATLLFVLIVCLCPFVKSQTENQHYYVTVGAFSVLENAVKFTERAHKANYPAKYAVNSSRKLYYVYVLETDDKRKAFALSIKLKVETEFRDAWVFTGHLGEGVDEPVVTVTPKTDPQPTKTEPVTEPAKIEPTKTEPVVTTPPVTTIDSADLVKPEGKPFFFKVTNSVTGADVHGEVHILTAPKATQYQAFPLNKLVYIKAPATGILAASIAAPGFKEVGRAINYNDPTASAAEIGPNKEAILTFSLVRVKLGDYVEFANVHFFPNSAILQPEARNELDGFVDLLKENMKYKIKIHGHANGKKPRDVVSRGTSTNFFGMDEKNVKETASAKRLSEYRAQIVKDYLVSQGIEASRIGVKGEGGNQMIYLPNSSHAARNDRVEIEVLRSR